jgi:hypothetical protein
MIETRGQTTAASVAGTGSGWLSPIGARTLYDGRRTCQHRRRRVVAHVGAPRDAAGGSVPAAGAA